MCNQCDRTKDEREAKENEGRGKAKWVAWSAVDGERWRERE